MSRTLSLIPYGQTVTLEPVSEDVIEILGRSFYSVRHELREQHGHQRLVRRWSPLFDIDRDRAGDQVFVIPRGLFPFVAERLSRHGIEIKQVGIDRLSAALADYDVADVRKHIAEVDYPLLAAVQQTDRAVIRYSSDRVDVARLIAQVALAWTDKTIIVLAKRVKDAEGLKRKLSHFLPDVHCFHHIRNPDAQCRVAISTYVYANNGRTAITKRDIVFALHPSDLVTTDNGKACVNKMWKARAYALIPDNVTLAAHVDDWITALFGANEVSIPAHGRRYRQVEVVFTPIEGGARPPRAASMLQLKKSGIWKHRVRNRRIAALAKSLADNDTQTLAKLSGELENRPHSPGSRVAVLVENITHALEVSKRLQNWSIVCGPNVWMPGLTPSEREKLEHGAGSWQRNQQLIVTHAGLERVRHLDVMIRADGGTGLPDLPHQIATCTKSIPPLVIVDFADRHHPQLRRWSRQRRNEYVDAGWKIANESPLTPLERFLATRPRGELA